MSYINDPRYLEIADQIENHSRAMAYLMADLNKAFPPENIPCVKAEKWCVIQHRPSLENLLNSGDR